MFFFFGLFCGLIIGASLYQLCLVVKRYKNVKQLKIGDMFILKNGRFGKLKGYHYDSINNKTVYEFKDALTEETINANLEDIAYVVLSKEF